MDSYSDVPDTVVQDQLVKPAEDGTTASYILTVFAACVLIKIITVTILGLIIKCNDKK